MKELKFNLKNEKIKGIGLIEPEEFFTKIRGIELKVKTHMLDGLYFLNLEYKPMLGKELENLVKSLQEDEDCNDFRIEVIKYMDKIIVRLRVFNNLDKFTEKAKISEWILK